MHVLIFDLFGVIARQQSPGGMARVEQEAGKSGPEFWEAYWRHRPRYDSGADAARVYWRSVGATLGRDFSEGRIETLVAVDVASWSEVDPEMVSYVAELRRRGHRLGLLSNIPAELADHYEERHAWLEHFEVRAFSSRIGHAKPARAAFTWCLEAFGVSPGEVLFIDDRAENVEAAAAVGMRGHVFSSCAALRSAIPTA
jgi:putative hydrolase of the HAD superfamily